MSTATATPITIAAAAPLIVTPGLAEIQIGWGEDTICAVCECPLPAGAPAWIDRDGVLCVDCAETEGAA